MKVDVIMRHIIGYNIQIFYCVGFEKNYPWNAFNCCHNGHFHMGILHDTIKTKWGCLRNKPSLGGFCHLLISVGMEDSTVADRR